MTSTAPRRSTRRLVAAGALAATGLLLTTGGVYAALNATAFNTTAQAAGSGTLMLTMNNNGVGFGTAVSNVAPGDTINRYVTLLNGGTLDAAGLTLGVTDATVPVSKLTSDAALGLRVSVSSCPTAWTPGSGSGSGTCATTITPLATNVPLATLKTTASPLSTSVAAGASLFLRVALNLPDQNETTVNGALPTATIQGLNAALTWTFTETQRAATTTTS